MSDTGRKQLIMRRKLFKRSVSKYTVYKQSAVFSFTVCLIWFLAISSTLAEPLFDGKTFTGWEGDTGGVWRIEDGQIIGGSLEKRQQRNDFLCTTKRYQNFDLHLKIKLAGTEGFVNSGIQFRSERIPSTHEVTGYQADFGKGFDGALYDECRRNRMLARPPARILQSIPDRGEWHDYRIRANGKRVQLWLNGVQTVDYTESDEGLPPAGVIALQIHGNAVAEVCFKDLVIEELEPPVSRSPRPPNIVFIMADDLGYRELGCYGQQLIRTPRIDRLAEQGITLTRHYAGNAVCAPSRCVFMTGKHPGHAFIRDNRSVKPEGQLALPRRERTVAKFLSAAGYSTGCFGKWGLGGPGTSGDPLRQGFDHFFGYNCQAHAHSYYPGYLWNDDKRIALDNDPPVPGHASLPKHADPAESASYAQFKGSDYAPDRILAKAVEFLRNNREQQFFLFYPSTLPHVALHVPDKNLTPYRELNWDDPPFTRSRGGYTPHFTPRAAYAAMITRLDTEVGIVLDTLDGLGLTDKTLVVFTSDNGTTHLRDEVDYKFFGSVGDLRGLKGSLYEGGVRVPCIARWPSRIPAGSKSNVLSGFEDWLPTLLAICNLMPSNIAESDGINLLPAFEGKQEESRECLYREFAGYGGQQAVWAGHWKAIRQQVRKGNSKTELYDLAKDPQEAHDVSSENPEILTRLENQMSRQHVRSMEFPLAGGEH